MDNINEIQTQMKNIKLTQKEIDIIYFTMKASIKDLHNIDWLVELTDEQAENYKDELNIIEKFSKL